jgi:pimeloyl-ACP methyl ester carboxylesterase
VSAFGVGTVAAVQRIAGEIRKLPAPILPIVRALWSQPDHHAAPYIAWQRDLALLSSRGRHRVASGSGHWIHLDHPELVTGAIREVVAAAREATWMLLRPTRG